jgi:cytochrome c peroxidase
MKRETQLGALLTCVGLAILAFALVPTVGTAAGQANGQVSNCPRDINDGDDNNNSTPAAIDSTGDDSNGGNRGRPRVYCPYPPGIIPADLVTESERVRREIRLIEQEALAQMAALGPLMPTSPNLTLAGNGMLAVQVLGKLENYDENLSVNRNVACAFCHMPYAGFTGPIPSVNKTTVAYPGSVHFRFGKRKPQAYPYSPLYPVLQFNLTQANFYGGNFFDLRATGYKTMSPDSEQAQGPPLDTQEMGNADIGCVVHRLSQARYRPLFEAIWGKQSFDIDFPRNTDSICRRPGGAFGTDPTPLRLSPRDRGTAIATYDAYAHSLTAFEIGPEVSPFSSKFDAFLAGSTTLTADEMAGYNLFRGKANCNSCHLDGRSTAPSTQLAPNGVDTGAAASLAPFFSDTTSSNLGLPKNAPANPFYYQSTPDSFGFTPNPAGFGFTDLGVGLFLRGMSGVNPNSNWTQFAPAFDGFMQVSTLRDVAMKPASPNFVKPYMHNGYLKSLKEVVHFYNTRDVFPFNVTVGNCPPGTVEKIDCWPTPEVPGTKDMTIGMLGLTPQEEDLIVLFMQTLTDGFTTPFPHINDYTGQ